MEEENLNLVTRGSRADEVLDFFETLKDNLIDFSSKKYEYDGVSIEEAVEKCPFKPEFFRSQKKKEEEKQKGMFKDKLLIEIGKYLKELKLSKKYEFVTDGIEAKKDISHLAMSERQLKKLNRAEREKTKGAKWFNMKAPEMTEELKNDLQVLQMRSALDPKHFYKRSEMKALPKYFEVGQVIDSPVEYHNSKDVRKRKRTLVDELMADAEFQKFNKKKFQESLAQKQKQGHFKKIKKVAKK